MSTPPSNLPFAPDISDEELDAELERFRPDQSAAASASSSPNPPPDTRFPPPAGGPDTPSPSASPMPQIHAMPQLESAPVASSQEPVDMFSNLDQSPKAASAPTGLGDLPVRTASSAWKYGAIFVGVTVVLLGVGYGFWYFAVKRPAMQRAASESTPAPSPIPDTRYPILDTETPPSPESPPASPDPTLPSGGSSDALPGNAVPTPLPPPVTMPPAGANVPPPETVAPIVEPAPASDADGDGLSDQRELEVGTDPRNKDSDGDELMDGDEVLKYGTNPVDRDTDKDSYSDGKEVQNGYNPRGGGKCSKADCFI